MHAQQPPLPTTLLIYAVAIAIFVIPLGVLRPSSLACGLPHFWVARRFAVAALITSCFMIYKKYRGLTQQPQPA